MSSDLKTSTANRATDGITTDAGTTAYLMIWTGAPPAKVSNAYVAPTGTLLASLPCTNPIAPASVNGMLTFSAITGATGAAAGVPGYYRLNTSATDTAGAGVVMQGTCGDTAASTTGDLQFTSAITLGGNVTLSGFTVTNSSAT